MIQITCYELYMIFNSGSIWYHINTLPQAGFSHRLPGNVYLNLTHALKNQATTAEYWLGSWMRFTSNISSKLRIFSTSNWILVDFTLWSSSATMYFVCSATTVAWNHQLHVTEVSTKDAPPECLHSHHSRKGCNRPYNLGFTVGIEVDKTQSRYKFKIISWLLMTARAAYLKINKNIILKACL